jgi:DNA invertase Pin-like site-specific DNA recombinase
MELKKEGFQKVTAQHLNRNAYLYVRQSTVRQTVEHRESTRRQYDLKQRAIALGWSSDQIVIIDDDLGQSAASALREGFKTLVSEVGLAHGGVVMSLEASRLARNCSEWHRLLEICALSRCLILDEDGIYDPAHFNDRLLLGLKGTMSEVELHMIRARLIGGMLNKASRGELRLRLPTGLVYGPQDQVMLDPDSQVQQSLRLFFRTYRRLGTVQAAVRAFGSQGLKFPRRMHHGPRKGELLWGVLSRGRAVDVLHNPRYAGAYAYGRRTQEFKGVDGSANMKWLPQDQWHTLIKNVHPGYISWQDYEQNHKQLQANTIRSFEPHGYPPREGPALLQGMVVCGHCGCRMSVRYRKQQNELVPIYQCGGVNAKYYAPLCQSIAGASIDKAVGQLLVDAMSPVALEVSLAVQQEMQQRINEADTLRGKQLERVRYEVELARRRYMHVDPEHRLVADSLEAEWNSKLREYAQVEQNFERKRAAERKMLNDHSRAKILNLATDFAKLWNDPRTSQRERKRMLRLLIEDVTLIKNEAISVHVRFKGGRAKSLKLPKPLKSWQAWTTNPQVVSEIDRLLDHHTHRQIANILNEGGYVSGQGKPFDARRIGKIQRAYGLNSRFKRLQAAGFLTAEQLAAKLGMTSRSLRARRAKGGLNLKTVRLNDTGQYLYEDPTSLVTGS